MDIKRVRKEAPMNFSYQNFQPECPSGPIQDYSLFHKDRPIVLSKEMTKAIEYLLWYVPNINSLQSKTNPYIEKEIFDDYIFKQFMEIMDIQDKDIYIGEKIPQEMVQFFRGKINTNCQKILLTQGEKETKTGAMLRHIRNAIAHGIFNVVDDFLICFDFSSMDAANKNNSCTAIVKIRPQGLLNALEQMEKEYAHAQMAAIGFKRAGYKIHFQKKPSFDFTASKDNRTYSVELKTLPDGVTLTKKARDRIITRLKDEDHKILLTSKDNLTDEDIKILKKERIHILSPQIIEDLFSGRDVLA